MAMVIYQSVGFDLSVMPGNLGDGRFNNYILEHGYKYLTTANMPYWDAPFFFPEKNVIAYSDNLFGALPIYVVCRFWTDRETAYQLWYIILIGLNFVGAYYALKKLNVSAYAASVGAFIYAFSLIILMQTMHIQMLPRFAVPFAIVSFYLWLRGNNVYFYISVFLLAYQFYCGIYLGYFLTYVLLAMFVVYLITERRVDAVLSLFKTKRDVIATIGFAGVILCLLGILFYPYYVRSLDTHAYAPIFEVIHSQPHWWNYFFTSDRSISWGWSNPLVIHYFVEAKFIRRENFIFIGMLPYAFSIAAFFLYRKDTAVRFFLITICIVVILTLSLFDFGIYRYMASLIPGALSIRVVTRYIVVAVFLWSILSALFLDKMLFHLNTYKVIFMLLLPILLVLDNIHVPAPDAVLKSTCQEHTRLMVEKYEKAKHNNPSAKAWMYYFNTDTIKDNRARLKIAIYTQMDVMMASQVIGMPCVNGYSAKPPPDYRDFFMSPSEGKLKGWLRSDRVRTTVEEKYSVKDILILK